jgi:polysaccharide export outer membrane protein
VFGQEGLTNAYLVDAAGCIDVPLIGQVLARGATTEELAYRIAAKLRNGFIREPMWRSRSWCTGPSSSSER